MSIDSHPFVRVLEDANCALENLTARSVSLVERRLTLAQYRTLVALASGGPSCVGALAASLDVHASTMTRMCDRLSARELITRSSSSTDHRRVTVDLTPNGRAVVEEIMRVRSMHVGAAAESIDPSDLATAINTLQAFSSTLRDTKAVLRLPHSRSNQDVRSSELA
jgi:DNA-binding MarR family transcriptional regulator